MHNYQSFIEHITALILACNYCSFEDMTTTEYLEMIESNIKKITAKEVKK